VTEAQSFARFRRGKRYIRGTRAWKEKGPYCRSWSAEVFLEVFAHAPQTKAADLLKRASNRRNGIAKALARIRHELKEDAVAPASFSWNSLFDVLDDLYYELLDFLLFGSYVELTGGKLLRAFDKARSEEAGTKGAVGRKRARAQEPEVLVASLEDKKSIRTSAGETVEHFFDDLAAAVAAGRIGGVTDMWSRRAAWFSPSDGLEEARRRLQDLPCWGQTACLIDFLLTTVGYEVPAGRQEVIHGLLRACFGTWYGGQGPQSIGYSIRGARKRKR